MYFDLTSEQTELCTMVDRALAGLIDLPAAAGQSSGLPEIGDHVDAMLGQLGLPLILTPEAHGGLGMDLLTLAAVSQVMGRHCSPGHAVDGALAAWLLAEAGTAAQRAAWLPGLLSGETPAVFALAETQWEPDTWDANLSGPTIEKRHVRALRRNGLAIVGTSAGLSIAPVGPDHFTPAGTPLDPSRPLATLTLPIESVEPLADRQVAWRLYEALVLLAGIDAVGAGQRALDMTVDYVKTREQFGRPIGSFQGLQHQLAAIAVDIGPVHFPCWFGAHAWDRGLAETRRSIFLAKAHATDMAVKTGRAAIECHGGIAYTWDYPIHLLLKRAMQDRVTYSSPAELRRRIARIDDAAWASA